MKENRLDNLPEDVQQAILSIFNQANIRDKIILLTRLEYGNDISYKDLSEMTGVTFQWVQHIFDKMTNDINKSPYLNNNSILSGVYYKELYL